MSRLKRFESKRCPGGRLKSLGGTPGALHVGSEHAEPDHVEQDVREIAVQEGVRDELPGPEKGTGWPERQILDHRPAGRLLGEIHRHIGEDEGLRDRRHGS